MAENVYNFKESEKKWREFWEKEKIYVFDKKKKGKIYSVDTPPPTVSGRMHIGHAFSYSQQDFIARYRRMRGDNVYYPFGTDDNGLPTERLVEKLKKVKSIRMPRHEFVQLCEKTIADIKPEFIEDWKIIGMSCDFSSTYSTIDSHCIKTSQRSFVDLFNKNLVYKHEAPTMWCVNCQTAIAQAELEDKDIDSTFNDIYFNLEKPEKGEKITIATTRPELLGACVCIYVHPDDKRYKHLVGKNAIVPLFKHKVPIFADESANPEKGTGILMVCSYGDKYDVEAINKRKLTPRIMFTKDGFLNSNAGRYKGLTIKEARKQILEDLKQEGLLLNQKHIKHAVNVHERCSTEIEFLTSSQWFIKLLDNKKKFIEAGRQIKWHPEFMRVRYEHWIDGLSWDWCISRQRHFGVPFPAWYCKKCGVIVVADEKDLPVDPLATKPKTKCKECGSAEFEGEKDVMDTWATSSVSPQIITNWVNDKKYNNVDFNRMYPSSMRPQAHEIIRTWAFYTIVKGIYHHNQIPWSDIVVSGYILDPHGEKMSKSKGNVVAPAEILIKYPADALRFGAASARLGEDTRYQEKELVAGQKTITKLWNAARFALMQLEDHDGSKKGVTLIDKWMLTKLNKLIKSVTEAFDNYEYAKAKADVDQFFWHTLCDNYLEIIKDRIYNPEKYKEGKTGVQYTLHKAILSVLKLFAPIMPYITEEIYHMKFGKEENNKSIHISEWPSVDPKEIDEGAEKAGDLAVEVIGAVRKFKSEKNMSLKQELKKLVIEVPDSKVLVPLLDDIKATTRAHTVEFGKGNIEVAKDVSIRITL